MVPEYYEVDAFSMQMAVGVGLVEPPAPVWWPEGGVWLVGAHSRPSESDWVLTRDGSPARFPEHHQAQTVANALGRGEGLPEFANASPRS